MAKKVALKKRAEENTTVIKKDSITKEEKAVKLGSPLDHALKKVDGYIGMSQGVTVNMGDYESFRVDCWLSIPLEGKDPAEKFAELSEIIQAQLEEEVTKIMDKHEEGEE